MVLRKMGRAMFDNQPERKLEADNRLQQAQTGLQQNTPMGINDARVSLQVAQQCHRLNRKQFAKLREIQVEANVRASEASNADSARRFNAVSKMADPGHFEAKQVKWLKAGKLRAVNRDAEVYW